MKPEVADLLMQAQESLEAAKLLHREGYHGFGAARAYYAMFYVAEAFLLEKGLGSWPRDRGTRHYAEACSSIQVPGLFFALRLLSLKM